MRRVLYIGGFELPDKNAAAQRVIANGIALRELGYQVSFVGYDRNGSSSANYLGFHCINLSYPQGIKRWFYHILKFVPIHIFRDLKPDYIILYNFPAIASLRILNYSRANNLKVFYDLTEWEQADGYTPRLVLKKMDTYLRMHYCIKKVDGLITISKYLYNYCAPHNKTVLIPPTVDLTNKKWERDRVFHVGQPTSLIYAGSPGAGEKDRLDLILEEVSKYHNISLTVIGINSEQLYEYYKLTPDYSNIVFKGRVSHVQAVKEVCAADYQLIIRNSSRKNNAGFPTKMIESFACCTPVISNVFSNITDFVKDGVNGFVVDDKNTLNAVLGKLSQLKEDSVLSMKKACLSMDNIDCRFYMNTFKELFEDK